MAERVSYKLWDTNMDFGIKVPNPREAFKIGASQLPDLLISSSLSSFRLG